MYWMFEPRSEKYPYGDDESAESQTGWDWKFILWLPIAVIIIFLISLAPFWGFFVYFLHDVYSTLKKTANTGELSYPFLLKMGTGLGILLICLLGNYFPRTPIQQNVLLILAIGFILIFTILPMLALCVYWIRKWLYL